MITSLFLFFVLGPVLGFACICLFALVSEVLWFAEKDGKDFKSTLRNVPRTFRTSKVASWTTIGIGCALLFLISPLLGYVLTLSTIASLLLIATGCACAQDNEFRGSLYRTFNLIRNILAVRLERWRGDGAASAPAPRPASRNAVPKAPAPAVCPRPKATPAPRTRAIARDGDAELLSRLLDQVTKLQQWTVRPDSERKQISELVAATSAAESALRSAADDLKTGTLDWNGVTAHVTALKGHNLPGDVAATLDKLVADRASAVVVKKDQVGDLAGTLDGRRTALGALVNKPQLSPEAALAAAETALSEAAELTAPPAEPDSTH